MKHRQLLSFILLLWVIIANGLLFPSRVRAQSICQYYPVDCPIYQTQYRYYDRWIPYNVYQYYDVPIYYDVTVYVDKVVNRTKYYDDPNLCPTPTPCKACPSCAGTCPTCSCP